MCNLSHKQLWRRTLFSSNSKTSKRSKSGRNPNISSTNTKFGQESDDSLERSTESSENGTASSNWKTLSFCEQVEVVLIPSVSDYIEAGIFSDLWWTASEYDQFHHSFAIGLQRYIQYGSCVKCRALVQQTLIGENQSFCMPVLPTANTTNSMIMKDDNAPILSC